jgi:hypothetical protein
MTREIRLKERLRFEKLLLEKEYFGGEGGPFFRLSMQKDTSILPFES